MKSVHPIFHTNAMKAHLFPLLLSVAFFTAGTGRANCVLWFALNPAATVFDGENVSTIADYSSLDGLSINAARVQAFGSGSVDDPFLNLYYEDPPGSKTWKTEDGVNMVDFDSSFIPAPWQPADLGGYANANASFELQLGFYNENTDTFTTLATATATYSDLASAGHISTGGVSEQAQTPWSPTQYTAVPEPATGMLALLGLAALLRSRRRPQKARPQRAGTRRVLPQPRVFAMPLFAPALLSLFALVGVAHAGAQDDVIIAFGSVGPDTYADGSVVLDGECYALVWSADGEFDGFCADGTPVNPDERLLLLVPGAEGGRLPKGFFQIPAELAEALRNGVYEIYLLDTRVTAADGSVAPRPPVGGALALVNACGRLTEGFAVSSDLQKGGQTLLRNDRGAGLAAVASQTTSAPEGVEQPLITAIRIEGDRAVLTVENLPGFIRVHGGETLDSVGSTVSPAMETKGGADVEMVAPVAGKESGFFRVLRN